LIALLMVVAAGAAILLGQLGEEVVDRARARTAADAAALAGVEAGAPAAAAAARANGGRLLSFGVVDGATEVRVRVGRSTAAARARPGPTDDRLDPSPSERPLRRSLVDRSQVARAMATRYGPCSLKRGYSSVG
jgi:hypothetical protein